ncbi:FixH family protein [Bdellovibrio bacteriovorus]|uniref:FixH family protein n=1 Tax=Bdellovibrio bacteriovorus TaxID=959 RepID=UPI003AA91242
MKHLLVLFAMTLCACARPDYLPETPAVNNEQNDPQSTCPLYFSKENICAELIWKQNPTSTDFSEFELRFNSAVAAENLSVILWMPSMGHGSSPVKIESLGDGKFRVFKVFFIMPGDWEIRIVLKDTQTTRDQVFVPLVVP